MKVSITIAALVLGFFAVASPLEPNASVQKEKKYDIRWCKKEHYDDCTTYDDCYTHECYNLGDGYNNKAESVKHSSHVDCYYYDDKHCKGDYLKAKGNYDELPKKWKDQISSWYCEEEEDNNHRD